MREVAVAFQSLRRREVGFREFAFAVSSNFGSKTRSVSSCFDVAVEIALQQMILAVKDHARSYGPPSHLIALPFLRGGGAELFAANVCRALDRFTSQNSTIMLLTDQSAPNNDGHLELPQSTLKLSFDYFLGAKSSFPKRHQLLNNLILAIRPEVLHVINSEVAWRLLQQEGERLGAYIRLFGSIFAFQFTTDYKTRIGYAEYFLRDCLPTMKGVITDNVQFIKDCKAIYKLKKETTDKFHVLYQPPRNRRTILQEKNGCLPSSPRAITHRDRPQFLWAGRMDEEKRFDLLVELARLFPTADFRVFGKPVVGSGVETPKLPNLFYEGSFSEPSELCKDREFDAFIFTSRWEGMPNILLEIGTLGIPIVAPLVGGVGELVNQNTGFPVTERPKASDYQKSLMLIVNNPQGARQKALAMRALIQKQHNWDNFYRSLIAVPGYLPTVSATSGARVIPANDNASPPRPTPDVSVIIPCYNQGHFLQESVASVLEACGRNVEIIIIDDGSTDESTQRYLSEAKALAPLSIRTIRQERKGLSAVRNRGIELAIGRFIQFLDADDLLAPGKIDLQITHLDLAPQIDISVCNFLLCDSQRSQFSKVGEAIAHSDFTLDDFLYKWERGFAIPIHCALFRRTVVESVKFKEELPAKEDWVFWTMQVLRGSKIAFLNVHGAFYRQHDQSMRKSYFEMGQAWLRAGAIIEEKLQIGKKQFAQSVKDWFRTCYQAHPTYRRPIDAQAGAANLGSISATRSATPSTSDGPCAVSSVSEAILKDLKTLENRDTPPRISVIVPIYGHFEHLKECLCSLGRQGKLSLEIICINDCSPDPRIAALMQLLEGQIAGLRAVNAENNQGISLTQNRAVDLAQGEYLAFLDCDDSLPINALQKVWQVLEDRRDIDYLFTDRVEIKSNSQKIRIAKYGGYKDIRFVDEQNITGDLLDGMVASHLKVIKRTAYLSIGGCNPEYDGVQDWDLALRMAPQSTFRYLASPLYNHRIHAQAVTRRDSVSQFRKSNMVRRYHLSRMRSEERAPANTVKRIRAQEMPQAPSKLRKLFLEGCSLTADLTGGVNLGQLNFMREFNAFFDEIVWSDSKVPAALYGYLWAGIGMRRERNESW